MKNLRDELYKNLINKDNFYMKQYYSRYHNEEVFLSIRDVKGGLYCALVTNEKDELVDTMEVMEYAKTLGQRFNINLIILTDGEYVNEDKKTGLNKIVVNKNDGSILYCDESCRPLAFTINNIFAKKHENYKETRSIFKTQPVTCTLIALNVIMFIITAMASGNFIDIDTFTLVKFGAKFNAFINEGQVWRLITCAFLLGGLVHIGCNMYSLLIIGPQIEYIYGAKRYIFIYIISCITSSLLSYVASPSISVGASGGIFGLMGALLAFAILERNRIEKQYISSLIQVIVVNLFIGLSLSNIDNFGHLGGFAGGILFGFIMYKMKSKKSIRK